MRNRPSDLLKDTAATLARKLTNGETENLQSLIDSLSELPANNHSIESVPDPELDERRIGIYKPVTIDGQTYFERDRQYYNNWFEFAKVHRIPPKSDRKRVVFLGESVARGLLYDPYYTPAGVLEAVLGANDTNETFEVIDLAVTNLELAPLRTLTESSLWLEPDALVVFAGNNWRSDVYKELSDRDHQRIAEWMSQGKSPMGIRNILDDVLRTITTTYLNQLGKIAANRRIPVVVVIPEFNLLDCQSTPAEKLIVQQPQGVLPQWLAIREHARSALRTGDLLTAETAAGELIRLDESHPEGFEILAECNLRQHRLDEARRLLETARDTAIYPRCNSKPRIYEAIKATIRRNASQFNLQVVDLADVFKQHRPSQLPGRDLFLDYCHLTAEGIQVAMTATADCLLNTLGHTLNTEKGREVLPELDPEAAGTAHLYAAIHNAHWGQPYEVLLHHCQQAVRFSSRSAEAMITYADLATRRAPANLCASFEKLINSGVMETYSHALLHPRKLKIMDVDLVDAMADALVKQNVDIRGQVEQQRLQEHGVGRIPVDLLEPYFHVTSYEELKTRKTAYYQAKDIQSEFMLVSNAKRLELNLTYRTPAAEDTAEQVVVRVNGFPVAHLNASREWVTIQMEVPADALDDGLNRLTFHWPVGEIIPALPIGPRATDAMPFYTFGEIHQFVVLTLDGPGPARLSPVSNTHSPCY